MRAPPVRHQLWHNGTTMTAILRLTLAAIFALIGVAGLLLPVLPGWLFFVLAVLVAFPRSSFAERVLNASQRKMPRFSAWLRRRGLGKPVASDSSRVP